MKLTILGRGKVGRAFFGGAGKAGMPAVLLPARELPSGTVLSGVVLIAIPDDQISSFVKKLKINCTFEAGTTVAHCSGSLESHQLSELRSVGCSIGSIHPLQTFPSGDVGVEALSRAFCFIEGDDSAVSALGLIANKVSKGSRKIPSGSKALYHSAAVFASNYLCTLLDASLELGKAAGISRDEMMRSILPLVEATVENVSKLGPEAALTGPIVRGDVGTVGSNINAIDSKVPGLSELYMALGRQTAELLARAGKPVSPQLMKLLAPRTC